MQDREFDTLMKRMDSQDRDLREIKRAARTTNGRVTALEKENIRKAAIEQFRAGTHRARLSWGQGIVFAVASGAMWLFAELILKAFS